MARSLAERTTEISIVPVRFQKPFAVLLIFGLPLVLTALFYQRILETDRGFRHMYDDAQLLADAANGLSIRYLLQLHGYHFIPVIRLTYLILPGLFGDTWTPYAIGLIVAHTALSASIGMVIYVFTRSLVLGASAAVLMALSRHLALGLLYGAVYINVYAWQTAILIVLFPALAYARRPSWLSLVLTNLVVAFAEYSLSSGLLAAVGAVLWYGVGRYVAPPDTREIDGSGSSGHRSRLAADLWFVGSIGLTTMVYLSLHLYASAQVGFKSPTEMLPCQTPDALATSAIDKFLYTMSHGFDGLVWPRPVNSYPFHLAQWRYAYPMAAAVLSAFAVYKIARLRPSERFKATPYAVFLALVILHVGSTIMLLLGRGCPPLDSMRYNAYLAMFGLSSACVALSWVLTSVPRPVRLALLGLVLVLTVIFIQWNVEAVRTWPFYADYYERTN